MARGGAGKALVIVFATLVVLGVAVDIVARLVVEGSLAERLRNELRLDEPPDVSLKGFPFLLHLARQRFPAATVDARNVDEAEGRVRRLLLEVEDLRFHGGGGVVRAERGSAELEIDEEALTELARREGLPGRVELLGPEVRITLEEGVEASVTGTLALEDGEVVFEPEQAEPVDPPVPLTLRFPLPQIVEGIAFREVEVREGVAVIRAALDASILRVRV